MFWLRRYSFYLRLRYFIIFRMKSNLVKVIALIGVLGVGTFSHERLDSLIPKSISVNFLVKLFSFFMLAAVFWAFWEYAENFLKFFKISRNTSRKFGTHLKIEGKVFSIAYTQKDDFCAMCLDHLKQDRVVTLPNCGHKFHIQCFLKWYFIRKSCATCLTPIE